MELQIPLILFMVFISWAGGLFATQGFFALKKENDRAQMPALIVTLVLLAIGGLSVFTHLQHWERIFNGFGRPTSGITQELVCIVLMFVVMVIFFVYLRKNAKAIPSWVSILAIAIGVITVGVTAHSYMMPARPSWNSLLWVTCMLGNACAFGPLSFIVISTLVDKTDESVSPNFRLVSLIGTALNAVLIIAYVASLAMVSGSFSNVGIFYDPTEPMREMVSPTDVTNVFSSEHALLLWLGIIAVGAAVPVIAAFLGGRKSTSSNWKIWGSVGLLAILVGALCIRVLFFEVGASVFLYY